MDVFSHYAPFIQDYIYEHGWQNLRPIQVAAAEEIFNTDHNVLLSASTASGKTEAAFSRFCQRFTMSRKIRLKFSILLRLKR